MMEWIAEHQNISILVFLVVFWGVYFAVDWAMLKRHGGLSAFGRWHDPR